MNAAALSPDAARLRAIRAALDAIAPGQWTRAQDERGPLIEARADYGEIVVLARFGEHATVDEVAFAGDAPDMVRFLLRLLDDAFAALRALKAGQAFDAANAGEGAPAAKNFAAECALKCKDFRFQQYLAARHGLEPPLTDDRAAQKVRSILSVQSRAELNDGGKAETAWKRLRADFAAYEKGQR